MTGSRNYLFTITDHHLRLQPPKGMTSPPLSRLSVQGNIKHALESTLMDEKNISYSTDWLFTDLIVYSMGGDPGGGGGTNYRICHQPVVNYAFRPPRPGHALTLQEIAAHDVQGLYRNISTYDRQLISVLSLWISPVLLCRCF